MDWGLRQWAPHLMNLVLDRFALLTILSDIVATAVSSFYSTRITHDFHMSMMLGAGYHRLNPQLPRNIPLDAGRAAASVCCVVRFTRVLLQNMTLT